MLDYYRNIFDFRNKRVVVTGGAGLLGKEIVRCYSAFYATTIIADVDDEKGTGLVRELNTGDVRSYFFHFDQKEIERIPEAIQGIEEEYGPVDVWVNNAYPRTEDWGNDLQHTPIPSWRENVDMHLNGYCICSNEIAKRMASRAGGAIVNIGSIQSVVAPDFSLYEGTDMTSPAAYTAIKGGIMMYSKYLASYYGKHNVRVNVICPGGIRNNQPEPFVSRYEKRTLLGRMAEPRDIAPAVMFLSSDAAAYVTGTAFMVDGGLTAI